MARYKDWFSVDVAKRASRVRGFPLAHVLKELLANSLDAGATEISLKCRLAEGTRLDRSGCRAFVVKCQDNGGGCSDPEVLRRVGSTTSDQSPTKRGRFGQGLIDVLTICEEADVTSLNHTLSFREGCCTISSSRPTTSGLVFTGLIRHPGAEISELEAFFKSLILPEGVKFVFNGERFLQRQAVRFVAGVKLTTPFFDPEAQIVRQHVRSTEVHLVPRFGDTPMIHELGIPVDTAPWSLPFDIDVQQKTPLDVDRIVLPQKYKEQLIAALVGPLSDLFVVYAQEHKEVPAEIKDIPGNASLLTEKAQKAIVEVALDAPLDKIVRRNPLDGDDRSESQELEDRGFFPVFRGHLPAGLSQILATTPTVANVHDEVCKAHSQIVPNFPKETERQALCLRIFTTIARAILGTSVVFTRHQGGAAGTWKDGRISLNISTPCFWKDPLGEASLEVIIHECAHSEVSGHCGDFDRVSARMGARLALWVAGHPEEWAEMKRQVSRA